MPDLVLGPLLRYADATSATVWVETDGPATVEVLGRQARSFRVGGHHFALVVITGLEPGSATPYDVRLDGRVVWPPAGSEWPASRLRTMPADGPRRIHAGSCRVDRPNEPPWTLPAGTHPDAIGHDALRALAIRLRDCDPEDWPDLLLFVGDQVYADEGISPRIAERIEHRQEREHPDAPRDEVGDFEEFTWLYRDSWAEPAVRWLLSTVPSAMIFDDHDVRDDWNISEPWRRWITTQEWWPARIHGALMTYWLYQHIGNLSPAELAADDLVGRMLATGPDEDAAPLLREALRDADTERGGSKPGHWSYCRDIGATRLLVVDSRSGRVLEDGHRAMLEKRELDWVDERLVGGREHLVVVTSLPLFLTPSIHHAETFWTALGDGAWGRSAARFAERVRRSQDIEHWAAFLPSFERVYQALLEVARGERGEPPRDIVVVSGDVHYSYLSEVVAPGLRCPIVQVTSSPIRNDLSPKMRRMVRIAERSGTAHLTRGLARLAGVGTPPAAWRVVAGPAFGNSLAALDLTPLGTHVAVEHAVDGTGEPRLRVELTATTAPVAPDGGAVPAGQPAGARRRSRAGER